MSFRLQNKISLNLGKGKRSRDGVYPKHSPFTEAMDYDNDLGRLPEEIKFVKITSIAWSPASSGFFY